MGTLTNREKDAVVVAVTNPAVCVREARANLSLNLSVKAGKTAINCLIISDMAGIFTSSVLTVLLYVADKNYVLFFLHS